MGGLTTAICLRRFGYTVTLFEAAKQLERLGAGINLSPHVTRIFRDLGLLDRMLELGVVPRSRIRRDGYSGEVTFNVPVDSFPEQYGAPHLIMHRGDLQDVLVGGVEPGAIALGKRLVDLTERSGGMLLSFEDGSTAGADIVIGADGINSRVREILLGPEPPKYTGEIAYRAIYPTEWLGGLQIADHTRWGGKDGLHILIYSITRARDTIYFVTGVPEADWGSQNYAPRPADMRALRDAFADFHAEVRQVLAAAPAATAWPVLERDPLPLWSKGNVVLLGDACHAMKPHMGQGAAMAIEDGVVLARSIQHFDARNARDIFSLYEAMRRDRASRVQSRARGSEDWMQYGQGRGFNDAGWLYGYDALSVPLDPALLEEQSL